MLPRPTVLHQKHHQKTSPEGKLGGPGNEAGRPTLKRSRVLTSLTVSYRFRQNDDCGLQWADISVHRFKYHLPLTLHLPDTVLLFFPLLNIISTPMCLCVHACAHVPANVCTSVQKPEVNAECPHILYFTFSLVFETGFSLNLELRD